jgi:hypothetical protein
MDADAHRRDLAFVPDGHPPRRPPAGAPRRGPSRVPRGVHVPKRAASSSATVRAARWAVADGTCEPAQAPLMSRSSASVCTARASKGSRPESLISSCLSVVAASRALIAPSRTASFFVASARSARSSTAASSWAIASLSASRTSTGSADTCWRLSRQIVRACRSDTPCLAEIVAQPRPRARSWAISASRRTFSLADTRTDTHSLWRRMVRLPRAGSVRSFA